MGTVNLHLHITGDAAADRLLSSDWLALMIGMLLDQQVTMESAFAGPEKLRDRLGGLDAATVAGAPEKHLEELFRTPPAIHRYPGSMAGRTRALCQALVDDWSGDPRGLWTRDDPDAATVLKRLKALPGYGDQKARIFVALLGKQCGVEPDGWVAASAPYGEKGSHRSVADIVDPASLAEVREFKKAAKAKAKAAKS